MPPMKIATFLTLATGALVGGCSPGADGHGALSASAYVPGPAGMWQARKPADLGMDPDLADLRWASGEGPDGR